MRIFVDVDGTLTQKQCVKSAFRYPPRQDVIDKVKKLASEGHEIVIFTGNAVYAKQVAELYGIPAKEFVAKPKLFVDNQQRRLQRRVVLPEQFLTMDIQ